MNSSRRPHLKGRGAQIHPPNRFESTQRVDDFEHLEQDPEALADLAFLPTEYFPDDSRTIVSENESPDIPFRYSLNPYRGCLHGCAYCYARPYHEYLGLNAGLDFESRIVVKYQAAELFREFLSRPKWNAELVTFSGVTDCYQPAERDFRLTRACLEVALEARQPISIITKNALVTRDLDLLQSLAHHRLAVVNISITTLDPELARTMEPRTSTPAARLRAMRECAEAGIPVNAMVAPIIPGLNDSEIPSILQAVSEAGGWSAGMTLLRLPLTVQPVFEEWLERTLPLKRDRIEGLIRACRQGEWNSSEFGERMRGTGPIAEQIQQTFRVMRRKFRLDRAYPAFNSEDFRPPMPKKGQLRLF